MAVADMNKLFEGLDFQIVDDTLGMWSDAGKRNLENLSGADGTRVVGRSDSLHATQSTT